MKPLESILHYLIFIFLSCLMNQCHSNTNPCTPNPDGSLPEYCRSDGTCKYCQVCDGENCRCESATFCERVIGGVVGGVLAFCFLVGVCAVICVYFWNKSRRKRQQQPQQQREYATAKPATVYVQVDQSGEQAVSEIDPATIPILYGRPVPQQQCEGQPPPPYDSNAAVEVQGSTKQIP